MTEPDAAAAAHALTQPPTYGSHQEAAAAELNRLLHSDHLPTHDSDVEQLLACRTAIIDALEQRLTHLGADPTGARTRVATDLALAATIHEPATMLARLTHQLPYPVRDPDHSDPPAQGLAPIDALSPSTDPTVEAWRRAAVEMLAGSHTLETSEHKAWLSDPGAAWWLIKDASVSLEAIVILDDTLTDVGLLADHRQREPITAARTINEVRMVTSQVTRTATWYADNSEPDIAVQVGARLRETGPVITVQRPGDLIYAQRQLAHHLLLPREYDAVSSIDRPTIDADTVRVVAASQLRLCEKLQTHCENQPRLRRSGEEFARQADTLRDIQSYLHRLVNVNDHGTNRRALWQQREVTMGLRRLGDAPKLDPREMHELACATHQVLHEFARSTRLEGRRANGNLRYATLRSQGAGSPLWRGSTLNVVLTAAIKAPAPVSAETANTHPAQRAALRTTVDNTPTGRRPSPYPDARSRLDLGPRLT